MRPCFWKMELGFWTYGWIRFLDPRGSNVVSRLQTPRSRHFSQFYDFIGFIWWFLRKWGPVCENWNQGSGLMAGYVFWAQVAQMKFLDPRPQAQEIFCDFIILLDSSQDSWENEVLFVKIRARVMDLWLDTSSGFK